MNKKKETQESDSFEIQGEDTGFLEHLTGFLEQLRKIWTSFRNPDRIIKIKVGSEYINGFDVDEEE